MVKVHFRNDSGCSALRYDGNLEIEGGNANLEDILTEKFDRQTFESPTFFDKIAEI